MGWCLFPGVLIKMDTVGITEGVDYFALFGDRRASGEFAKLGENLPGIETVIIVFTWLIQCI